MLGVCRNNLQLCAVASEEYVIFREERSNCDELIVCGSGQSLCYGNQCRSASTSHEQLGSLCIYIESLVQVVCDSLSYIFVTCSNGVSVQLDGVIVLCQVSDGLVNLCRSRNARVAQGVVEYILRSYDLCLLQTISEERSDSGRCCSQSIILLINHFDLLLSTRKNLVPCCNPIITYSFTINKCFTFKKLQCVII